MKTPTWPALLAVLIGGAVCLRADVVINELHFNAESNETPSEFIELYNSGALPVDLSGWRFEDGISFTFPAGTILGAGEFLVLAQDSAGFAAEFGPRRQHSPLAHWTFDETSGTTAADATGTLNANGDLKTAVAAGGATLGGTGQSAGAAVFDGQPGSYFTVPYLDGIHTASYTLAAWVKPADAGVNPIISDWAAPQAFILFGNSGVPTAYHRYSAFNTFLLNPTPTQFQLDQWQHVAVSWDRPARTARLYLNGAVVRTQIVLVPPANLSMLNNNRPFHLGWKQDSTDTFNGLMDEVWVISGSLNIGSIGKLIQNNSIQKTDVIDLADIVGGGDGSLPGTGTAVGIDAATGALNQGAGASNHTPATAGGYYETTNPFVDGTFVPNGTLASQPVTSSGLTFAFTGTGNAEVSYGNWFNGPGAIADPSGASNLPLWSSDPQHSLLSAHAQKGITFDLDAIEAAHGGRQVLAFSAIAGDARTRAGGNIAVLVLVDGVEKFRQANIVDNETGIEVKLGAADRFLTLVVANGLSGNANDHAYFGDAFLHIEAAPVTPIVAFGQFTGSLQNEGEKITLRNAANLIMDEVNYQSEFPWPVAANGDGPSMELINPGLDNDLSGSWRSSVRVPTPGQPNSVSAANAPPQMRQVDHLPQQPLENEAFSVQVKATDPDGVASVLLAYQVVAPGNYVRSFNALTTAELLASPDQPRPANPAFEAPANWTTIPMRDDGTGGDAAAGDDIYTAQIPGQPNRTLVRYRITAADTPGHPVRVPYADDPSLNFACFVYNGVPDYVANTRSISGPVPYTHSKQVMESLPVYHLLTQSADFSQCIAYTSGDQIPSNNFNAREAFNWNGTFVYNGKVYDHIRYRLRQRNARYLNPDAGKRSFRFRFNRGNYPQFHDIDGEPFPAKWRTLNSHKMTARGGANWGLHEFANTTLWELFGTPSPRAYWYHFRVIRGAEEAPAGANGQHLGDFYGMWLGIEDYDVRFLETRNLEKGNLYKLISFTANGKDVQRYQSHHAVPDATDYANILNNLRPARTNAWLEQHVDWPAWFRYHTVVDAVRHYDVQPNTGEHLKNRAWWFRSDAASPQWGKLVTLPWDSDTSWGPNWNGGVDFSKDALYGTTVAVAESRANFLRDYRNVIREFRDLVWQPDQINQLVDRLKARLEPFSLADRDKWTNAPATAGVENAIPIASRATEMKNFAFVGGSWTGGTDTNMEAASRDTGISGTQGRDAYLDFLQTDAAIPNTPTITYSGAAGYPLNGLAFTSSSFTDPQGNDGFGAMQWRIGEYEAPSVPPIPAGAPTLPRFEYAADWLTAELTAFNATVQVPAGALRAGRLYRARVRHRDDTGRWSHWSAPVEFTTSLPDIQLLVDNLEVSEIMYQPAEATAAEVAAGWSASDFEYVEVYNRGPATLDLTDVRLTKGVDVDVAPGTLLAPGAYAVVVRHRDAFALRYGTDATIIGEFRADRLDNGGEQLKVSYGAGAAIRDFIYDDAPTWPTGAQGSGCSISLRNPQAGADPAEGMNWIASLPTPGESLALDYACWASQIVSTTQAGPMDDADGDGLTNVQEFGFGTPPEAAGAEFPLSSLVAAGGQDYLALTYSKSPVAARIQFVVEVTGDLNNWQSAPGDTIVVSETLQADGRVRVTVRDALAHGAQARRFIRLRIVVP